MERPTMHRSLWPALLGALAATLAGHAHAAMTFHCTFDNTVAPRVHDGDAAATLTGKAEYVDGLAGQALVVGDGRAQLAYARQGNYSLKEATVSFWVKPLDWSGDDKHFHIFFQASDSMPGGRGRGARLLYKYVVPGRFLNLAIPNEPIPYVNFQGACYSDISHWRPGQWHHVVGTWRHAGMGLYLDGKPIGGKVYPLLPKKLGVQFLFGDRTWGKGRDSRSAVDELVIFDRCLNETEIALLHVRHDPSQARGDGLTVALRPFLLTRRVEVYVDTWHVKPGVGVRAQLARGANVLAGANAVANAAEGLTKLSIPLTDAPPGSYQVRVEAAGRTGSAKLTVPPDPPWLGSKVGVSESVPAPWTDVRTSDASVHCWNRRYDLAPGPLPQQIVSAHQPTLAGPVQLRVQAGDRVLSWRSRKCAVTESKPAHVAFAATAAADRVELSVNGRVEFDGMCWLDTTLTPTAGDLTIDRIVLDVPLRSEHVRFWRAMLPRLVEKRAGEVAQKDGVAFSQPFLPALWLGCDERGLQWFAETSEPWDDPSRGGSIRIVRAGKVTYLRITPIASKRTLSTPWRFAFGLQASPVRPVDPKWRRYRLSGMPGTTYMIWTNPKEMVWFGYPKARDPETLRARVAGIQKRNVSVIPYSCPFLFSVDSPENKLYGVEWVRQGEGDSGSADVVRMGGCAQYVAPCAPHYADFTLWAHQRFVKEIGWNGLYFDHSTIKPYDYAPAGCGYWRDGKRIPTYPILAQRDMMKRMYVMLKAVHPDHWLMIHTGGQAVLPIHGFADVRAVGEDLGMRLRKTCNYHEILTEAEWRAALCGQAYGFSNVLLPKIPPARCTDPEPTEQLMGLLLLYGMDMWPGYSHGPSRGAMRKACDRFGIIGAAFVPFWSQPPLVTASHPAVRVSVYQQPGQAMLVLVNKGKSEVAASVRFDPKRLGVGPGAPWRDLHADRPLPAAAPIAIRPGNYRVIQVGP